MEWEVIAVGFREEGRWKNCSDVKYVKDDDRRRFVVSITGWLILDKNGRGKNYNLVKWYCIYTLDVVTKYLDPTMW